MVDRIMQEAGQERDDAFRKLDEAVRGIEHYFAQPQRTDRWEPVGAEAELLSLVKQLGKGLAAVRVILNDHDLRMGRLGTDEEKTL